MSSKARDVSQSSMADKSQLGNGLKSNQNVTPVEEVAMFNTVMNSQQADNNTENQKDAKDKADEQIDAAGGVQKNQSAKEGREASEDKKTADPSEDVKSQDEANEIREIEAQEIRVTDLAAQLQVMLQAETQVVDPHQVLQNVVTQKSEILSMVQQAGQPQEIDPELLRKVDVKTLKDQLNLAMKEKEPDNIPVPHEIKLPKNLKHDFEVSEEVQHQFVESVDGQNLKLHNFLKGDDFDLTNFAHKIGAEKPEFLSDEIAAPDLAQIAKEELTKVLDVYHEEGSEVQLNIVSVDLNRINRIERRREDALKGLVDFDVFDPSKKISDLATAGLDAHGPDSMHEAGNDMFANGTYSSNMVRHDNFLQPLQSKVEIVMLQMVRADRSGVTRIQVYPPYLGAIDIKLEMNEKNVKAHIITQHQETKELLQKNLQQLKDVFTQENFHVDGFDIEANEARFQQQSSDSHQDKSQSNEQHATQTQTQLDQKTESENRQGNQLQKETHEELMQKLKKLARNRMARSEDFNLNS